VRASERWTAAALVLAGAAGVGASALLVARSCLDGAGAGVWAELLTPAALGMLPLAALRGAPASRTNALLAVVSVAVTLVACDAALAVLTPTRRESARRAAARAGRPFDARSGPEVARAMQAGGVPAVPVVSDLWSSVRGAAPSGGVVPLAGVRNALTVFCNESGAYSVYRSDDDGFNNPAGPWPRGASVAAVGDSFVHGMCVAPDDNLVGRLRRWYPDAINAGFQGTGPIHQLAVVREYVGAARPATVLWFFYENDLADLRQERAHPVIRHYLRPGFTQALASHRPEVDARLARLTATALAAPALDAAPPTSISGMLLTALRLRRLRELLGVGLADRTACDAAEYVGVLDLARREIGAWGGRLVFVALPGFTSAVAPRVVARRVDRQRARVLAGMRALGVPTVDLTPAFRAHPAPASLFAYPGSHYDSAGYALAAETVARALGAARPQSGRTVTVPPPSSDR
jgi:hypothetical protein